MASPTMMPEDVVFEILSRVPVKSACRFRCVSSAWDALITGPAFVAAHRARTEPLLLFLAADSSDENTRDLRLMDTDGNVVRVIKRPGVCTYGYRLDGTVCITNDYLGVESVINAIDLPTGAVTRISTRWNRESFWDLNVGCAAPSRTYKVVWLTSKHCKVLTLQDGHAKWRHVQSPSERVTADSPSNSSAVTVNGVMHFLSGSMSGLVEKVSVLRFDLESEEWRVSIKGPTKSCGKPQRKTKTSCMVKLNNTLCMVQRSSTNMCLIWLLNDPTKGVWEKSWEFSLEFSAA
ncbi:putative F-box protein At1g19160 [Triticum aestivum]|uniref:putative F-box protein At1g19160 n=1 Tax=Triticum aestivum TaxID=4565 RepID=UPI001D01FDDC|nr:putative F-box protein At1g19160 [Triticum aestivum]